MDTASDQRLAKLLEQSAQGDENAFKQLYDETSPYVFAVALKMLRDRPLAEDALQDVFVKVWYRAATYHADRGSVMTWLTSIVRYRAIDLLRARRDRAPHGSRHDDVEIFDKEVLKTLTDGQSDSGSDSAPMATAIAADDSRLLRECIQRLSGSQIQSIALAFFRGLTHQELADWLEIPLGTIKSRLRRSLMRLKDCLGDLGMNNEISTGTG